jgi:hypothetical protein
LDVETNHLFPGEAGRGLSEDMGLVLLGWVISAVRQWSTQVKNVSFAVRIHPFETVGKLFYPCPLTFSTRRWACKYPSYRFVWWMK